MNEKKWIAGLAFAAALGLGCTQSNENNSGFAGEHQNFPEDAYYVSPDGDDANRGTRGAPWQTAGHAGRKAQAGDTVIFLPGEYSGRLVPANSGTAEAPIVFRAAENRRARLTGHAEGEDIWETGETQRIAVMDRAHIEIRGFLVEDTTTSNEPGSGWMLVRSSSHITIEDCRFEGGLTWASARIIDSEQIFIRDNDFSRRSNRGNMVHLHSSRRILFEANAFSRAMHTLMAFHLPYQGNQNVVVRGNVFHSGWSRNFENFAHPEVLVENNIFVNAYNGGQSAGTTSKLYGDRNIFRFNQIFRNYGPTLVSSGSSNPLISTRNTRLYHNVFHGNMGPAYQVSVRGHMPRDLILKNNIFSENDPFGSSAQVTLHNAGRHTLHMFNNVFYAAEDRAPPLLVYSEGAYVMHPMTLEEASGGQWAEKVGSRMSGNRVSAPQFAAPEQFDFSLRDDSAVRDTAAPLTTTSAAGKGRILPVADPYYFYDGYGIAGEVGDLIAIGSAENLARVVRVDYEERVLHLDRDLEWGDGAAVGFAWSGSAPDPGVFESGENGRPSVQVLADRPVTEPGEEVVLRADTRGLEEPLSYVWQLGDDHRAEGDTVVHRFEEERDYGIRVRVTDALGETHLGVGYVTAERPPPEDVLIHSTFDANDEDWWVHWQFYRGRRGTGGSNYEQVLDEVTGEGYIRIYPRDPDPAPLPAFIHPRHWEIEKYPYIRMRYRIPPGVPVAVFVRPFRSVHHADGRIDSRDDSRRHYLAGSPAEPRGTTVLHDDGEWHEVTLDARSIRQAHPDVQMLEALHIGDLEIDGGAEVSAQDEFWINEVYIGR